MNPEHICKKVIKTAKETGTLIRKGRSTLNPSQIKNKGLHDFVTAVDKAAEDFIYHQLVNLLPDAGFIGEEQTHNSEGKVYNWIIDPLDGTTNFIHGLPPYAVSIGLMKENSMILGVVHEVNTNETFYAWENSPAFMNNKTIKVSEVANVEDALIATGFPYSNFDRMNGFMKSLNTFMKTSHGLRRLGSASIDLAYLACGRFEAFYEYDLSPWDVAAGAFIVQQAGGMVSDFSGGNNFLFGKEIIATNGKLFESFLKIIKENMADD